MMPDGSRVVPFREYPVEVRPVLGVRYCTVCGVVGEPGSRYEHGWLLWADEPFTAAIVAREMTSLGFQVIEVSGAQNPQQPWSAAISAGPPHWADIYVGIFDRDCASIGWVGLWSRRAGRVVHDMSEQRWQAVDADQVLYEQRDLYELPRDDVVILTAAQATGLAIVAGQRLPTATEITATVRTAEQADWSRTQLWQRFHDHRAQLFADEVQRLRAEGARLGDTPPHRQTAPFVHDRDRVVAGIPGLPVRVGAPFPLLRFLVGTFHDRTTGRSGYGSCTVVGNRLDITTVAGDSIQLAVQVMVRGGLLVHGPAFTPFCPSEADYADDPELDLAQSGDRWSEPLWCAVFPALPGWYPALAQVTPTSV